MRLSLHKKKFVKGYVNRNRSRRRTIEQDRNGTTESVDVEGRSYSSPRVSSCPYPIAVCSMLHDR
jgi:hypothetical protein